MDESGKRRRKSSTTEELNRERDHSTPEHPGRATDQPAHTGTTGSSRRRVLSDVDAETWTRSLREQQADHQQAEQQRQRRHKAGLIARPVMDDTNEKDQ